MFTLTTAKQSAGRGNKDVSKLEAEKLWAIAVKTAESVSETMC